MNIIELLKQSEGKTLEFKRDLSAPQGVVKTIIAFANTSGGILLIGIEDKSKTVCGVRKPLELEERVASLISDQIAPRLIPDIEILSFRNKQILAVQVYPSAIRPHYLIKKGEKDGVFMRIGSTNRVADLEVIAEMQRLSRGKIFDEQPLPDVSKDMVDYNSASEIFAPVRKLKPADLETLHVLSTHQGRKVPTAGGILLFGKNREDLFPDAWIQVGRFQGTNKSRIIDSGEIRSYPALAVDEAVAFVTKHSLRGAEIGRLRRKDYWNLPPIAVREAIVNAVVHCDYSLSGAPIRVSVFDNRLEVENPGLLPYGLTVENLHQGISKIRNRVFGRVFHSLGIVEQWGSGIQRMMAACSEAGLAEPLFEEIGTRFRVTIFSGKAGPIHFDKTDKAILDALSQSNGLLTSEVANVIGLSTRATRDRLGKLAQRGFVQGVGTGPQDPKRRYYLTNDITHMWPPRVNKESPPCGQ